ncbi:MAG: MBL fold metallo-hydrolase [Rhizobiales bacterium NRL2]|nr:MAG: MBL fold metallo-hydrolase [Rhizobiales bacterium NRL2]
MSFKVKFWGVRGSIATPGPRYVSFGGNTSCIEVACGGRRIIFDAGTGIRNLGHWLTKKNVKHAHMLLSHTHWDHINGFPFFSPAFKKDQHFTIMAGHLSDQGSGIREVLASQMTQPTFPVPIEIMQAKMDFEDFSAGDTFTIDNDITIRTTALNHPDGATAYRVDYQGNSMCYVTDTEHVPGKPDENILALIEGADVVIYDCTYSDKEFESKVGWGHSTWQEGMRLCQAANVRQHIIFHHDPDHEDMYMERLEEEARFQWIGNTVARENMRLRVG